MRAGLTIFDADRHVVEPLDMWPEYLEPRWRDGAPYLARPAGESLEMRVARLGAHALVTAPPVLMLDDRPLWNRLSERAAIELAMAVRERPGTLEAGMDPAGQLASMDECGIDRAWLFPTVASNLAAIDGMHPDRAGAFARAYNNWLRDYCAHDPARLRGVGLLARHDPRAMVAELVRVTDEFGWSAVVIRPEPVAGRNLSHEDYRPFFAACEGRGVAIAFHGGAHAHLPTAGAERFASRFAQMVCAHPLEQMLALLTLIEGGVLERHPRLRVAFLEAGCSWVPAWLWRMDHMYQQFSGELGERVPRPPSEYVRRQCFIGAEPDEPGLIAAIEWIGADRLVFGTDFPHHDHPLHILDTFFERAPALPDNALTQLLSGSAGALYACESG